MLAHSAVEVYSKPLSFVNTPLGGHSLRFGGFQSRAKRLGNICNSLIPLLAVLVVVSAILNDVVRAGSLGATQYARRRQTV